MSTKRFPKYLIVVVICVIIALIVLIPLVYSRLNTAQSNTPTEYVNDQTSTAISATNNAMRLEFEGTDETNMPPSLAAPSK